MMPTSVNCALPLASVVAVLTCVLLQGAQAGVVGDFNHVERCKDSLFMGTPPRGYLSNSFTKISLRSSSVYQQGEAVFLEASVDAPLHPPLALYVDSCVATLKPDPLSSPSYKFITKHGCLMDSMLPGSSSKFLPREQDNRLCFSVQAFHFNQSSGEQMFISCHIRATLKQNSHSHLDKACFFHRPTFSWRATEGDNALCGCCDSDDCLRQTGHTAQPDTEKKHEGDTTVGPLLTLPRSHWIGHLSVHR